MGSSLMKLEKVPNFDTS